MIRDTPGIIQILDAFLGSIIAVWNRANILGRHKSKLPRPKFKRIPFILLRSAMPC